MRNKEPSKKMTRKSVIDFFSLKQTKKKTRIALAARRKELLETLRGECVSVSKSSADNFVPIICDVSKEEDCK
jgi:hypothetical protein